MLNSITILALVSAAAFLYYGMTTFFSRKTKDEFARLGQNRFRILIGFLQLAGVFGILIGLYSPLLGGLATMGISTLMLLAVVVRIRNRDKLLQTLPAFFYLCLNIYLTIYFLSSVGTHRSNFFWMDYGPHLHLVEKLIQAMSFP